jgi:hypothetical protein
MFVTRISTRKTVLTVTSFRMAFNKAGVYFRIGTVWNIALKTTSDMAFGIFTSAYLWLAVALDGTAFTMLRKLRVFTSSVKCGIAKKLSNIPLGGFGPS